jgi:hypothetical protein
MKSLFFLLTAFLTVTAGANAADSSASSGLPAASATETSTSGASPGGSGLLKKFDENGKITDAELKSREGSLSLFSLKANFSYYGPTLDDLSAVNQPNLDGAVTGTAVGPSGSVGARYRFNPTTSVTLNAGLMDQYLFTNRPAKMDVNNPYVTYDKSFKVGGVQMVASPGVTWVTSNVYRASGEAAGLDARLYSSYNLGQSPISVGASTSASYYFFDRAYIPDHVAGFSKGKPIIKGDGKVRQISITVAPVIKYNVTSKFNVNTSWGFNFFNPRYYESGVKMNSRVVNEWVGIGYAVTRNIYINPYIQFYPTQFNWKSATMNLSTVISLL